MLLQPFNLPIVLVKDKAVSLDLNKHPQLPLMSSYDTHTIFNLLVYMKHTIPIHLRDNNAFQLLNLPLVFVKDKPVSLCSEVIPFSLPLVFLSTIARKSFFILIEGFSPKIALFHNKNGNKGKIHFLNKHLSNLEQIMYSIKIWQFSHITTKLNNQQ